jgi:NAD(P)-dependent dehydrogenase (short-subunit alcohol dehydrogenase family)
MGKVCVITGASQGIGRAAAVEMSRQPDVDVVILIARNAEGLAGTAAAMAPGTTVRQIPYDLADLDGIPALVEQICEEHGASISCSTSRATPSRARCWTRAPPTS